MSSFDYDLIVIGAGSGGISAANLSHGLGKKTALVEKNRIGGECTWSGCVPSKALIRAAETAHEIRNMQRFGLTSEASIHLNTDGVMDFVRGIIQSVYEEEKPEVFAGAGIDVYLGGAEFLDNHTIQVGDQKLTAKSFLISTGSSPSIPDIPGLSDVDYLTNETLFDIQKIPASLIVLGGGPIGLEMAQAFSRLGSEVTVVQRSSILKKDDRELVGKLVEVLREEGLRILTGTTPRQFEKINGRIKLSVTDSAGVSSLIEAEAVLVATGRVPNVSGLGLEKAGVSYSSKGIAVDATLRTRVKNIYAVGDVINAYLFSHMAEYQSTLAVQNAVLPLPIKKKVDYSAVPWATFTDPELAHSGLTEAEAREKWGDRIRIYRQSYEKVDRAKTDLATEGLGKFIFSPKAKLVGIHILGKQASELLHEAQLTRVLKVPFSKLSSMIHIYPTYGDVVKRPANRFYADQLQNLWIVKLVKKIAGK